LEGGILIFLTFFLVCHCTSKRGGHKKSYRMNDTIRALCAKTTCVKKGMEKATENKMGLKKSGQKEGYGI